MVIRQLFVFLRQKIVPDKTFGLYLRKYKADCHQTWHVGSPWAIVISHVYFGGDPSIIRIPTPKR